MKININTNKDINNIQVGDMLMLATGDIRMIIYGLGKYHALDLEDGQMCCVNQDSIEDIISYYRSIGTIAKIIKKDKAELKEIKQ